MQRVAIARSIVNEPDIILADEPTGALDSVSGVQVMELLKEISSERLVIMVSHFGIIRTSSLFVGCSDYFCIWTISADGKARRDAIAPWANDRYSVGLRPPYGLFFMIEDLKNFKNFTK